MKICSKCKIKKDLSEFYKRKERPIGVRSICKECTSKYDKKLYKENKKEKLENYKEYNNSKANYDTYASRISYVEKIRNVDGLLQVKCTYCGKWYFPTVTSIKSRIYALNGKQAGEQRLYCSTKCKQECPIYHKKLYQEGHPLKSQNTSREVQPELRQIVFERDEHTCIKCGKHQDELTVPLHCHHIEGIQHNPIESADIDMCVTVCKICHNEIHQENGCSYNDMKCKNNGKK